MNSVDNIPLIASTIPGAIWYSATEPFTCHIQKKTKAISLSLNRPGILNLAGLSIDPPIQLGEAFWNLSSTAIADCDPSKLASWIPIHTHRELNPQLKIIFNKPRHIDLVRVYNREGRWSSRGLTLRVCLETEDEALVFEPSSWISIRDRLYERAVSAKMLALSRASDLNNLAHCAYVFARAADGFWPSFHDVTVVAENLINILSDAWKNHLTDCWDSEELGRIEDILDMFIVKSDIFETTLADSVNYTRIQFDSSIQRLLAVWASYFRLRREGLVKNGRLYDFETLLPTILDFEAFEAEINKRFKVYPGGSVQYTAHGLMQSDLISCRAAYLTALEDIIHTLQSVGFDSCICYGTLLGARRTQTFIPHDDDVDIAVLVQGGDHQETLSLLKTRLSKCGYLIETGEYLSFAVRRPNGKWIDVFPCFELRDGYEMYGQSMRLFEIPKDIMYPFEGRAVLYGTEFPAPNKIDEFLLWRYGPGWIKPEKFINLSWLSALEIAK